MDADEFEKGIEEQVERIRGKKPEEKDTFEEPTDPAVLYVLERWDKEGDSVVVEGRVEALTVRWAVKRQLTDAYESDEVSGFAKVAFDNLKCDFAVDKVESKVGLYRDDSEIVGEVFRRLGRIIGLQTYDLMVQHKKTIYAMRDGKPQRVSAAKEVKPATENTEIL